MVNSWVDSQKEAFLPLGSDSDCVKVFQGVGYCAASAPYCISSALLSCDIETSSSSAPKPCDFIRDFIEMSGRSQRKCCVFRGQSPVNCRQNPKDYTIQSWSKLYSAWEQMAQINSLNCLNVTLSNY